MPARPESFQRFVDRATRLGALVVEKTQAGPLCVTPGASGAARIAESLACAPSDSHAASHLVAHAFDIAGTSLLVLLPAPEWLEAPADAAAAALGLPLRQVRDAMAPFATFASHAANLAVQALSGLAADLSHHAAAEAEHEGVLASFTDELSKSYETLALLYSIGNGLSDLSRPERFLQIAIDRLQAGADFATIAVRYTPLDSGADDALTSCREPARAAGVKAAALALTTDHAKFAGPKRVVAPGNALAGEPTRQSLVQPLVLDGAFLGYLIGADKGGGDPLLSSYDLQLFQATASFLSAFLQTCRLFEDQRRMFIGTIRAMTAAIDAKDRYTRGHSERVAWLSAALARALGVPEEEVKRIHIAGLVHDVGKIGVPEAVLCKPGRLTDDEFAWIKKHPEIGHRILAGIPQLADILPGVLHHHERFDGKGYPHGLAGHAIPRMARIISVADTFDALSSTRSYRSARPRDVVLAEIAKSAGTQLDPEIAAALASVDLTEFDRLLCEHATSAPATVIASAA